MRGRKGARPTATGETLGGENSRRTSDGRTPEEERSRGPVTSEHRSHAAQPQEPDQEYGTLDKNLLRQKLNILSVFDWPAQRVWYAYVFFVRK